VDIVGGLRLPKPKLGNDQVRSFHAIGYTVPERGTKVLYSQEHGGAAPVDSRKYLPGGRGLVKYLMRKQLFIVPERSS